MTATPIERHTVDLIFQLLEVDGVKRSETDTPEPFKTFTDETIANFRLAGALELHYMRGLRGSRDNVTEISCELHFWIDEFRRKDFCALFD